MEEITTKKPKKVAQERGKGFPVLSLPEAVKIIRDAGVYGNTHHIDALATYAGHSTANSGAFRSKVAALRDWGLIAGNGDAVSLTDSAIQLANPVDQSTTIKVLQDVFKSSELFWDMYTNTAKGVALDIDGIANKGVTTYRVSVKGKRNFAQSFIESAESVNLLERVGDKVKLMPLADEPADALNIGDDSKKEENAVDKNAKKKAESGHAVNQTWEFEGGSIDFGLYTESPLDSSAYTYVATVIKEIEGLQKQLAKVATIEETPNDDPTE